MYLCHIEVAMATTVGLWYISMMQLNSPTSDLRNLLFSAGVVGLCGSAAVL